MITLEDLAGDPHPHIARLRALAPVAVVPALGGFIVTARAEAIEVLRDTETFTVDDPRFSTAQVVGPSMLSLDGAEHARHREPFVGPFRPRQVSDRFGGFVAAAVHDLIDSLLSRAGRVELRSAFAGPLAASVVAESLGLDGRDNEVVSRLLGWYHDIVDSVSGVAAGRPVTAAGGRAMAELGAAVRPYVEGRRHGDSLLHDAAVAGGLDHGEVLSNAAVIMFGGIETTEGMILNALWYLLQHPAQCVEVVAQPELAAAAVEESLRLEPAAAVVDRYATRAVTLGGAALGAGDLVVVSLAGANRDPAEFADPDRFDIHRPNLRRHLAFAAGPHVCVGMDLARLEARTALTELLARLPGLRLDDDAPPPSGLVFRKPPRLPVRWGAVAAPRGTVNR